MGLLHRRDEASKEDNSPAPAVCNVSDLRALQPVLVKGSKGMTERNRDGREHQNTRTKRLKEWPALARSQQ